VSRKFAFFGLVIVLAAAVMMIADHRKRIPRWPIDSTEGKAAARVEAFVAGAYQAEIQAYQPLDLKGLVSRDKNEQTASEHPKWLAKYQRDLQELVGVHCSNDCWKSLGGGISQPPTFDPSRQRIKSISAVDDGRIEVEVETTGDSPLDNNVVFHLEYASGDWKVSNFFFVSKGPRNPFPPTSDFASPPPSLKLPEHEVDIGILIPELAPHMRTAIALHPYRDPNVAADSSHFGGLMMGNEPEGWPRCQFHNSNHIGVLQLLKQDYPELPFPHDSDIFQLTWCPMDHEFGLPEVTVRWRTRGVLQPTRTSNPDHKWPEFGYLPQPCRIYADKVTEYPSWGDERMDESMRQRIGQSTALQKYFERHGATTGDEVLNYFFEWFGPYYGTKLFGHAAWIQSPETPTCNSCGTQMQLLVSIQSWEPWRHDKHQRQPIGLPRGTRGSTTDLMIGDAGCAFVFICRQCPDLPIIALMQGS